MGDTNIVASGKKSVNHTNIGIVGGNRVGGAQVNIGDTNIVASGNKSVNYTSIGIVGGNIFNNGAQVNTNMGSNNINCSGIQMNDSNNIGGNIFTGAQVNMNMGSNNINCAGIQSNVRGDHVNQEDINIVASGNSTVINSNFGIIRRNNVRGAQVIQGDTNIVSSGNSNVSHCSFGIVGGNVRRNQ